jgi:hypothetical protein
VPIRTAAPSPLRSKAFHFDYETGLPTTPHEMGLSDRTSVIQPRKWHCIEVYFDMATSEARI